MKRTPEQFVVVHPLDDVREQKVDTDSLGPIRLTAAGKIALLVLRAYLVVMMLLVAHYVFRLAHC